MIVGAIHESPGEERGFFISTRHNRETRRCLRALREAPLQEASYYI